MDEKGTPMPFGKHKRTSIEDLPYKYLTWLLEQDWFEKDYPSLFEEANEEWKWRNEYKEHLE